MKTEVGIEKKPAKTKIKDSCGVIVSNRDSTCTLLWSGSQTTINLEEVVDVETLLEIVFHLSTEPWMTTPRLRQVILAIQKAKGFPLSGEKSRPQALLQKPQPR